MTALADLLSRHVRKTEARLTMRASKGGRSWSQRQSVDEIAMDRVIKIPTGV